MELTAKLQALQEVCWKILCVSLQRKPSPFCPWPWPMYRMLPRVSGALAGMYGPICVTTAPEFAEFSSPNATHLVWATGGSMVPEAEIESYLAKGKQYL